MNAKRHPVRKGIALILAMVFVVIFSAISIGFLSLSSANTQVSVNHRDSNEALAAALSGLDCAMYVVRKTDTISTSVNTVSEANAQSMWTNLYAKLQSVNLGSAVITKTGNNVGDRIYTAAIPYSSGSSFEISYSLLKNADNTYSIKVESKGTAGNGIGISRKAGMTIKITKDTKVLSYAIASRGRMWLTGDTTIHGSVYSAWNLSNSQLTQLAALETQLAAKLAAGTLNSTALGTLISSLSLSTANKTTLLNALLNGTLSPKNAPARCISMMDVSSSLTVAPFNMTGDSTVLGSMNTCWTKDQVNSTGWHFESDPIYQTDAGGNYVYETDDDGNYLVDDNGNMIRARVIDSDGDNIVEAGEDEIQGVCAGVNYGETPQKLAGLNITDYDTTSYKVMANYATNATVSGTTIAHGKLPTTTIGGVTVPSVTEYFPHASGSYTTAASASSLKVTRKKYEGKTMRNVVVSNNTNALFKNCTFEEVLYVDCSTTGSTNYNNVRFENCTFNGVIVTNTPQTLSSGWWQKNCLYFTGTATFQNNSSIPEATILAPHFNVNLGNTNPNAGENNVLTGAIVGGIVDIRGNAQIYGTIISMADTSSNTSGYVTNIGATENDGGSETTEAGDIGTIEITPTPDQLLPSGITTPVIFDMDSTSYSEPRD